MCRLPINKFYISYNKSSVITNKYSASRLILFIIFVIWSYSISNKKPKRKKIFYESEGLKHLGFQIKEFYKSKELKHIYFEIEKIGKVKDETFFYRNGKINKIKTWKNGILEGQTITFYPTGEKYIESNYSNGKLNGPYTVFSKSGSVLESFNYDDGVIS
jgi:antitoxin component YwqK of YwqJK toxin-antitoxin module